MRSRSCATRSRVRRCMSRSTRRSRPGCPGRSASARAIDKLGDEAVRELANDLVGALRGDAEVGKIVQGVLGARKGRVVGALVKGLETGDDTHARRILELVNALADACEILCDAI